VQLDAISVLEYAATVATTTITTTTDIFVQLALFLRVKPWFHVKIKLS